MKELIAICIITCRRNFGLEKLLDSIAKLNFNQQTEYDIVIMVVDNDINMAARKVCSDIAVKSRFPVIYFHEIEAGIPFARNRAIKESLGMEANIIAFLDDDEYVDKEWLNSMLDMKNRTSAKIVWGPVYPVFLSNDVPKWAVQGGFFDRQRYKDGVTLSCAASNNVMIDCTIFSDSSLRFNENMRHTGGTDHLFFKLAHLKGHNIVWSANSIVWEDIPESRISEKWICNRFLRLGNTHALTETHLDSSLICKFRITFQGLIRLTVGSLLHLFIPFVNDVNKLRIKRTYYRGLGMLFALYNSPYNEYQNTDTPK